MKNVITSDVKNVISEETKKRVRGRVSRAGAKNANDIHENITAREYSTKDAEWQVMQYCSALFASEYARVMCAHVRDVQKYARNCGKHIAENAKSEKAAQVLIKRMQLFGLACCRALPASDMERASLGGKIKAFINGKNALVQAKEKAEKEIVKREEFKQTLTNEEILALVKARGLSL